MKKFFAIVLLAFSFATASFAGETVTVTGKDLSGAPPISGGIGGMQGGGVAPGRPAPQKPRFEGNEGGGGGVRRGCQECQSDTALYTCGVWKASPINETWDKTQIALSGQNCCAASGGRVLSTRLGSCGS